MLINVGKTQI